MSIQIDTYIQVCRHIYDVCLFHSLVGSHLCLGGRVPGVYDQGGPPELHCRRRSGDAAAPRPATLPRGLSAKGEPHLPDRSRLCARLVPGKQDQNNKAINLAYETHTPTHTDTLPGGLPAKGESHLPHRPRLCAGSYQVRVMKKVQHNKAINLAYETHTPTHTDTLPGGLPAKGEPDLPHRPRLCAGFIPGTCYEKSTTLQSNQPRLRNTHTHTHRRSTW